ncbi:hypothetical protein CMV_000126 [Castanea mollissima]|uniref:Uncharacterized protein n=1 Tax=Castanea mollissima TaxID=60419 RepID=A0A8J4RZL8_9ROSI|nr:hypothetical protein CMV_000126 [Castanea mollissima]
MSGSETLSVACSYKKFFPTHNISHLSLSSLSLFKITVLLLSVFSSSDHKTKDLFGYFSNSNCQVSCLNSTLRFPLLLIPLLRQMLRTRVLGQKRSRARPGYTTSGRSEEECFHLPCAGWYCEEGTYQDSWFLNSCSLQVMPHSAMIN